MAEGRRYTIAPQLDIEQILLEAQNRWLRPVEICEILRNYKKFRIAPEPPNKPPSGSLFLFDRKVLRYFRKDGHNWRKKKDGKTVKEAHERLKSESVDVLHCYYAHGEENENFQRRTYWLLDEDYMHIVLVHYLEVKGSKSSFSRARDAQTSNPASSNSFTYQSPQQSQATDAENSYSAQTSEYEDAESDTCQRSSRYYPFPELQQYDDGSVMDARLSNTYISDGHQFMGATQSGYTVTNDNMTNVFNLPPWSDYLEGSMSGLESGSVYPPFATEEGSSEGIITEGVDPFNSLDVTGAGFDHARMASNNEVGLLDLCNVEGSFNYPSLLKQKSLELATKDGEGLKKYDSFSRWMSSELEEVDESHRKSTPLDWDTVGNETVLEDSGVNHQVQLDAFLISPSLSKEQLFSIGDFCPTWAYSDTETEVQISGTFLKGNKEAEKCKWSCMFGDVEVPAEMLTDCILLCHAPRHKSGRVPFYITCSNRLACSEVREFEFRDQVTGPYSTIDYSNLHMRLEKLLSLEPADRTMAVSGGSVERPSSDASIDSLFMESNVEDVWSNILKVTNGGEAFYQSEKTLLNQDTLKENLRVWLLHKRAEDGKGPNVLDKEGQGVLHLAAALGYDWALEPTLNAGVHINFRDVHGWTALHWAALCGRERTVVLLACLGADAGAVTDPTPEFPSGRTSADLASSNGHKGIAGFLAESSLVSHLSTLTLKEGSEKAELSGVKGIEDIDFQNNIQIVSEHVQGGLALKDSLGAVRNAALAAARIHQVFRVKSFQRKQMTELAGQENALSDDALSAIYVKSSKQGQQNMPAHVAATRIQNKFRGWKGRKDFLIFRQRIIKIQAHVRGHQVRKHYRKIVWSVGIVEKAILRWRRKGCGLRGFRREGLLQVPSDPPTQIETSRDEDDDILKVGRKQIEAKMDKALARVKSMVRYPEARDQYRRLLTLATEIQESKAMQEDPQSSSTEAVDDNLMTQLEEFLEDDMFDPST